jgi:hypothetical protein
MPCEPNVPGVGAVKGAKWFWHQQEWRVGVISAKPISLSTLLCIYLENGEAASSWCLSTVCALLHQLICTLLPQTNLLYHASRTCQYLSSNGKSSSINGCGLKIEPVRTPRGTCR